MIIVDATLSAVDAVGAYTAERAAALSGVPKSTMHWWARKDILVPSVSRKKVTLWSYADLMGLRVIYWLRQRKVTKPGIEIPRTSMPAVRRAIGELRSLDMSIWDEDCPSLLVDVNGKLLVKAHEGVHTLDRQIVSEDLLDLIAPFTTGEGTRGPDLVTPRPDLRIVPGKLSGSPHVARTRLETRALSALASDGFDAHAIQQLYPYVSTREIDRALDLEQQLNDNLGKQAAQRASTVIRRLFALDHNFPQPLLGAMSTAIPQAELGALLALHTHERKWDGMITNDDSVLSLPKEMTALEQTGFTLVVAKGEGHNPIRAVGVLLCHLGHICHHTTPGTAQIWKLKVKQKTSK